MRLLSQQLGLHRFQQVRRKEKSFLYERLASFTQNQNRVILSNLVVFILSFVLSFGQATRGTIRYNLFPLQSYILKCKHAILTPNSDGSSTQFKACN